MSVMIAFGTVEGQTGKIARFIEKLAKEAGEDVHIINTSDQASTVTFEAVESVILAASVHERKHPKKFEVFVASAQTALAKARTLMISVSISAAFPEGRDEAQDYLDEMKMRTGLDPDVEMLVAGAIRSREYDFYATQVLKHVVLRGRSFDPAIQEHEFTDWEELSCGVHAFLEGKSF